MASLCMHVIYDHPSDFPHHYVVRRHHVAGGRVVADRFAMPFDTLSGARSWCRALGLVSIGRLAEDDPAIAEVWT